MRSLLGKLREHSERASGRRNQGVLAPPRTSPDPAALLRILYREDKKPEERRHGSHVVHASSLCHGPKCVRALCLGRMMRAHGVKFEEPVMGAMRLVWKFGRVAEEHARSLFLQDEGVRYTALGKWECRCKTTFTKGRLSATPPRCDKCGSHADRYSELTLHDPNLLLSGNPDFLPWQGDAYTVVEFKSVKEDTTSGHPGFDDIKSPLPVHVEQGCSYVRLMRQNGFPVHREPVIIYIRKKYNVREWYKALIPERPQLLQAEAEIANGVAMLPRYGEFAEQIEAGNLDAPVPDKIPLCAETPEALRGTCPHWIECVSHA